MENKKKNSMSLLLDYAANYKWLTFLGMLLSAVAIIMGMLPYICIWLIIRDLLRVAPNWGEAVNITKYGWLAFGSAFGGILVYFTALMCTHLAAFRTASNIRKRAITHLMKTPLGFFDNHASGYLRNRIDGAAGDTETLLAHNLADIVGVGAMFLTTLVLMLAFDWRMGLACLFAGVISIAAMFQMMGGKNAQLMAEYQTAQDIMSKAGTEFVRGIPVVKIFQQTVYSFKAFEKAINDYSEKAEKYQGKICCLPQSVNLTAAEMQKAVHRRMKQLLDEEKYYCDKGNYSHMCQIITSIALYEVLQDYGKSEAEAYSIVSEEMWKFLDPSGMQKLARKSFFLPLMKKIVPFGFRKGSGIDWRYTWHDDDSKDEFHFECNECIYQKILGKRNMMKLGAMCCHADIINYGNLPYTDFIRTETLCQEGEKCDFRFVRHQTDAGESWERTDSI